MRVRNRKQKQAIILPSNSFLQLPDELLCHILLQCNIKTICMAAQVNRRFRDVIKIVLLINTPFPTGIQGRDFDLLDKNANVILRGKHEPIFKFFTQHSKKINRLAAINTRYLEYYVDDAGVEKERLTCARELQRLCVGVSCQTISYVSLLLLVFPFFYEFFTVKGLSAAHSFPTTQFAHYVGYYSIYCMSQSAVEVSNQYQQTLVRERNVLRKILKDDLERTEPPPRIRME